MNRFGWVLLTVIQNFFIGAFTMLLLGGMSEVLPRLVNWFWSLPMWAYYVSAVIVGYLVVWAYKSIAPYFGPENE